MSPRKVTLWLACTTVLLLAPGCGGEKKTTLEVWGADSLAASLREMKAEFEKLHPEVSIALNVHGSVLVTRLLPDHDADVVALADYRLVQKVLYPDLADWVAKFVSNEIVLAGHASSGRRAEITSENWYDLLLKPDIQFGIANPTQDPCGYWSRLVWHLAEKHYFTSKGQQRPLVQQLIEKCPEKNVALDANRLISDLLVPARVDYAFVYKTHAVDYKLPCTPLPKEINLSDPEHAADYAMAEITVPDYRGGRETIRGTYIAFGLTIAKKARHPELAQEFVRFMLSARGMAILKRSGFNAITPARVPKWCAAPAFLGDLARPED
ncbi:MAG TPA: extracellular solute-binding protein [Planctomycetota bacterium]|nr:extracellular solute-binding protein [Planctomycetota bacterium]